MAVEKKKKPGEHRIVVNKSKRQPGLPSINDGTAKRASPMHAIQILLRQIMDLLEFYEPQMLATYYSDMWVDVQWMKTSTRHELVVSASSGAGSGRGASF